MYTLHEDIFRSRPFYISPAGKVSLYTSVYGALSYHFCKTSCCSNIPCVNQTVEMPGRFFDLLPHVIVTVEVEDIGDKVESVLVVLNISVESRQIEAVCEVVFVNLTVVFVAPRRNELSSKNIS